MTDLDVIMVTIGIFASNLAYYKFGRIMERSKRRKEK